MPLDGEQLADDDVPPLVAASFDALDLHPQQRQPFGERLGRQVEVDVVTEPGKRDFHRNCSRNRRSFSMNRRRSLIRCLSIEIRSGPMPKAKPW